MGYKASLDEETLHKLVTYSVQNDLEGIDRLLFNTKVFDLPANKEAYVIKSKLGRVKIKLIEEQLEVWTFSEAIKSK